MQEPDDYDQFLDSWVPGERLRHATLDQYIHDNYSRNRLIVDSTGSAPLIRTPFSNGPKVMDPEELASRRYEFFHDNQQKWASEFKDYILSKNVSEKKLAVFISTFATSWVDGMKRRQHSQEIMSIKASIAELDRELYGSRPSQYVINQVPAGTQPLFTPEEMKAVFDANDGLIDALLPDYVDYLDGEGPTSLSEIYVRRGVYMPHEDETRRELHYLSSYSIAIGPVEQFAQTWTPVTRGRGVPCIFSAPLAAIQRRVVAFAPFIENMDLSQLEFVVAPPTEETPLIFDGEFSGTREYSFT